MRQVAISMHDKSHAETHHFCSQANQAQDLVKFRTIFLTPKRQMLFCREQLEAQRACRRAFSLKLKYRLKAGDIITVVVDADLQDDDDNEYFCVTNRDYPALLRACPGAGILSLYYLRSGSTFMREVDANWRQLDEFRARKTISDSILLLILASVTMQLTGVDTHSDSRGCVLDYCQNPSDIMDALKGGFRYCPHCLALLETLPEGRALVQIADRLNQKPFKLLSERTVFLSYAWADKESVLAVDQWLRNCNKGLVTRIDQREFFAGKLIDQEIRRVIRECSVVVVFYSRKSKRRDWPEFERDLARERANGGTAKVIYFCLDNTPLPGPDSNRLSLKVKDKTLEVACQELLSAILEEPGSPEEVPRRKYEGKAPWWKKRARRNSN